MTPLVVKYARLRRVFPLLLVLGACGGGDVDRGAGSHNNDTTPQFVRSPQSEAILDSLRKRRSAALRTRPDTLGMHADSARVLGAASAKVWVIVMSDFQCEECGTFASNGLAMLRQEFIDKGLVRLAFVNNPQQRHFNSRFAALAALCAATAGRFWEMHDSLFANQRYWAGMPDPRPYLDSLAVSTGVPAQQQADCRSRNRMLLRLSADIERSRQTAGTDVPVVFVNDRRLERDELSAGGLRRAVRAALGEH